MSESPEIPTNPVLSPGFARAQRLSRILVILLTIGFWLFVVGIVAFTVYMASPDLQALIASHSRHPIKHVDWGTYAMALLSGIPCLIAISYARRLFARFAEGDVCSVGTIALLRTSAMWITIAGILPPRPLTLVVGIATYVVAYVMAEAARLADDSASIV